MPAKICLRYQCREKKVISSESTEVYAWSSPTGFCTSVGYNMVRPLKVRSASSVISARCCGYRRSRKKIRELIHLPILYIWTSTNQISIQIPVLISVGLNSDVRYQFSWSLHILKRPFISLWNGACKTGHNVGFLVDSWCSLCSR